MYVAAASVTDVASLNATNTSITIPVGTKQPANPDSGCGCYVYVELPYEAAIAHCSECFMSALTYLRVWSRAFVRACLRACVRACVRACRYISQNRITSAIFRPFH